MLQIAFAGTPEFAVPTLQALAKSSHRLVGVLTQPDRPAGRGRTVKASPVKQLAQQLGLPLAQPASLKLESDRLALTQWNADLLVVVAYGLILPAAALAIPARGCLNVHASLLPRWRGAAPVQRAILAGDECTGVTIMQMEAGLDTGPILLQRSQSLDPQISSHQLLHDLSHLGASALMQSLEELQAGTLRPQPQSQHAVTYASKIDKQEAQIDWRQRAEHIARQVRAFNPWPVAQTLWNGQQLRIWQARAIPGPSAPAAPGQILGLVQEQLMIQCGHGALAIERLQLAGKRTVSARDFVAGRALTGMRLA